jgi:hypothetical protein
MSGAERTLTVIAQGSEVALPAYVERVWQLQMVRHSMLCCAAYTTRR